MFFALFKKSIKKMAGDSTSTVKSVNPYPLRTDVVKFNGKNNFDMSRCEVMDALMASNLEDNLQLEKSMILLLKKIRTR